MYNEKPEDKPFTLEYIITNWDGWLKAIKKYRQGLIDEVARRTGLSPSQPLPPPNNLDSYRIYVHLLGAWSLHNTKMQKRRLDWNAIHGGYWLAFRRTNDEFIPHLND